MVSQLHALNLFDKCLSNDFEIFNVSESQNPQSNTLIFTNNFSKDLYLSFERIK